MRHRRATALATAVALTATAGLGACARDEGPTFASVPPATAAPTTTSPSVPRPPLPEVTVTPRVTVPANAVVGPPPIRDRVVLADPGGSWVQQAKVSDQALVRLDPAGAPVSEIALPVDYVAGGGPVVSGSTVWLGGSDDTSGGRQFSLLGADLTTGRVVQLPIDALPGQIDVIDGVTWVVFGSDNRSVQPFTPDGPAGPPTPIASEGGGGRGALGRIATVTPAGTFDCIGGHWRVTPHGGETTELAIESDGCNAVPVGGAVLHAAGDHLLRLSVDGVSEVSLPEPMSFCDGPRQATGAPVLLVCRAEATRSTVVLRVDPTTDRAEVALDLGTGLELRTRSDLPATTGPGQPLALLGETQGLGSISGHGVLVTQDAAGNPVAGALTRTASDHRRWFGDALWLSGLDDTWSQVTPPNPAS